MPLKNTVHRPPLNVALFLKKIYSAMEENIVG